MTRPILFVIAMVVVLALLVWTPAADLAGLRQGLTRLQGWRQDHALLLGLIVFAAYVVVAALFGF